MKTLRCGVEWKKRMYLSIGNGIAKMLISFAFAFQLDESLFVTDGPDAELSYMERQLLQHTRNEERKPVPATGPSQATADATVASSGTGLSATDSTAAAPILTVAPRRRCSVMMVLKVLLLAGLVLVSGG